MQLSKHARIDGIHGTRSAKEILEKNGIEVSKFEFKFGAPVETYPLGSKSPLQPFKLSQTSKDEMNSIHDYTGRLERCKRTISKLRNGDLALRFLNYLGALGLSTARISKYAGHLPSLLRAIEFNPSEATREDIEKVVAWINSQPYKELTKRDLKITLRKFIQYAKLGSCDKNTQLPPEVTWFSLKVREKDSRATPENLLTPEDFKAIVQNTENRRDRALVHVLFEAALRPGELLGMTIGSVQFKENYCLISVNGKTGIKRIPLVVSFKPLLEWLREHPYKNDLEAPLWISLATNYKGKRLCYRHFRLTIKRLVKKAEVKKNVWPYLFRHSSLTALAKVFTEARLEQYAGWVHGSKMTRRYVHFSARDLEDAVLELHGFKKSEGTQGLLKLVECQRCRNKNSPANVRCGFCGMILDKETAFKIEEREQEREKEILDRLERLEQVISSLLANDSRFKITEMRNHG